MENKERLVILVLVMVLCVLTFSTSYYGLVDVGDYSDTGKYFAGDYKAKIRSSHSYSFGFLHSPLLKIFQTFIIFKFTSLIFLFILIFIVYILSGKNKKVLWMMLLSPFVWYMSPWISPIQLSSILFFLGYFCMKKYLEEEKLIMLISSGILVGFAWVFWDAILLFLIFFTLSFLYDKKLIHYILFITSVIVGLLPKLILDHLIFGFAFMGIMRYVFGLFAGIFFQGIYGNIVSTMGLERSSSILFSFILILPYFYGLIKFGWQGNKRLIAFLIPSLLVMIITPQIRYILFVMPMMIFELVPRLNEKQFRRYLLISIVFLMIIISPHLLQMNSSSNIIEQDLLDIGKEFPNESFIVGNEPDDYQTLAHIYWGESIKEFISVQDYNLFLANETNLFSRGFSPKSSINNRRTIWLAGGMDRNLNDKIDYDNVNYALGIDEPINLEGFELVKNYDSLSLYKKMKNEILEQGVRE